MFVCRRSFGGVDARYYSVDAPRETRRPKLMDQPMTNQIIIRGVTAVTMDPELGDQIGVDILVEGDRIAAIGRDLPSRPDAQVIEASGMIAMPGMVDGHRHVWQTQLRGVATDWTIVDYAERMRTMYCVCYEPEDAYLANLVGGLEAINAGITSIIDHSHLQLTPDHSDALARGLKESGIAGYFCYGFYNNPPYWPGDPLDIDAIRAVVTAPAERWHVDNAARVRETHFSDGGVLRFGISMSEIYCAPMDEAVRELTTAWSLEPEFITSHWYEGSLLRGLHERGLLRPNMLFTHCNQFTPEDFALLAEIGIGICSTPDTELGMGLGFPIQQRTLEAKANAVFGVDICSNLAGDILSQVRLALQSQRWADVAEAGRLPAIISAKARDYLNMVTQGGANAIGMGGEIGSLTPGKRADLTLVRTDGINMVPVHDPIGALVFYANTGDIDTVMIAGRVLKSGGQLKGVDWPALSARLTESRRRIDERFSQIPSDLGRAVWGDVLGDTPSFSSGTFDATSEAAA
ncbi:amidohydrolase family protein [Sphingomonas sp. C8-2]|nr:amidohydrolase family protein [Sphingomonas sp. C8-2]